MKNIVKFTLVPIQKITKREIIEAARQVFTKQGYHKTTMNDIAEVCGIQKGSLYHHFKGKEELMKAAIDSFHHKFKEGAFNLFENTTLSTQEKLNKLIDFSEKTYLADEGSMMASIVLETINVVPGIVESIRSFFNDWIDSVSKILEEVYEPDGARKIAKESIAAVEGAVMMMQIFNDTSFLTRVHEGMRRRVAADIKEAASI